MVQALEKHFNPIPLEIAETGESIGEYVLALKKTVHSLFHCHFAGEFLNRALRDRFVCGLKSVMMQNKLLNIKNITFDKACQINCEVYGDG